MCRPRVREWTLGLAAAAVLSALPSAAEAHTLTIGRAKLGTLYWVRGIAYSFDVSADPIVTCVRYRGDPHNVYCNWRFQRADPGLGTTDVCRGRVRVYVLSPSLRLHRSVVRPRRCIQLPT